MAAILNNRYTMRVVSIVEVTSCGSDISTRISQEFLIFNFRWLAPSKKFANFIIYFPLPCYCFSKERLRYSNVSISHVPTLSYFK